MFDLLFLVSTFFTGKELVKEKLEKPAPTGTRFDWDAYWKDIENGMTTMEQIKKRERGGYNTTEPLNIVVDVERYKRDKKNFGETFAENQRERGSYRKIRKY